MNKIFILLLLISITASAVSLIEKNNELIHKYRVRILLLLSLMCFYWAFLMQPPPPYVQGVPMFAKGGYAASIHAYDTKYHWFMHDDAEGSVSRFEQLSGLLMCAYLIIYLTFSLYSYKITVIVTGALFAIILFILLGNNSKIKAKWDDRNNRALAKHQIHIRLFEHALPAFLLLGTSLTISYTTI